jgi:hypothetical protein
VRTIVLSLLGLLVCLIIYFRTQWDTDGDPVKTWDWVGAPPPSPPPSVRRWFVRYSPIIVLVVVGAMALAAFAMR